MQILQTKNSDDYPFKANAYLVVGKLTLTVYRGGIEKYLVAAQELVDKYGLPKYYTATYGPNQGRDSHNV